MTKKQKAELQAKLAALAATPTHLPGEVLEILAALLAAAPVKAK